MLFVCGISSMAARSSNTVGNINGNASCSTSSCSGNTTNKSGGNAFVSVKVQYRTTAGITYWSSPSEEGGASYVNTYKSAGSGNTAVQGQTAHGSSKTSISFNLNPLAG